MKNIFFLICLFAVTGIFAQAPTIEWQKTIGCTSYNPVNNFIIDNQGNYLFAGIAYDSCDVTGHSFGWGDGWIIKTDTDGNRLWSVVLGADSADEFFKIIQTADNGYVAVGRTLSQVGPDTKQGLTDCWIVKLDVNGNLLWQRTLGSPGYDDADDVAETATGDLIIAGATGSAGGDVASFHGGTLDAWIIKLNSTGTVLWEKTYGSTGTDYPMAIKKTVDNNYIITGKAGGANGDIPYLHSTSYPSDVWVMKINDTGGVMWSKTYGGYMNQVGDRIIQTQDGGYLVGAESTSGNMDVAGNYGDNDMWAIKLDDTGKIQWQKNYGGSGADVFTSIIESKEGGYLFTGTSQSVDHDGTGNHGTSDLLLIKTDNTGNIRWSRMYGGTSGDATATSVQTSDSTYVTGGVTNSHNGDVAVHFGVTSAWVFRLNKFLPVGINNIAASNEIKVFPTVTDNLVTVKLSGGNTIPEFKLYDMTGRLMTIPCGRNNDDYTLSLSNMPGGIYVLHVISGNAFSVFKIIRN